MVPLPRRWQTATAAWIRRRQGTDLLPRRLDARRLYILPTRAGWAFAVVLLGMLFGGLNYGNSLALLLTFALAGLGLVAMVRCHRSLLGLEVLDVHVARAFAGDPLQVTVRLRPARGDARDLLLRLSDPHAPRGASVAAWPTQDGLATARLAAPPAPRGPWRVPRLRLACRAPFGLFECWAWLHVDAQGLVWPAPQGNRPLPEGGGTQAGAGAPRPGLDEWSGLRPFRDADSPRQVAWKAYARGAPLLVREYHDPRGRERRLRWQDLADMATEARLGQLTRWVVEASRRGEHWSLELPGQPPLGRGTGTTHRERCLDALALFGLQPERP